MNDVKVKRYLGMLSVIASVLMMVGFIGLKIAFGYPNIIRENYALILTRLYFQRTLVPYLFYGIGLSGFLIVFISVILGKVLNSYKANIFTDLGKISGIIYGVLLFTGITRYTKLFPLLAEMYIKHQANAETIKVVFTSLSEYLGLTYTEHIGFMFLITMILCFSIAICRTGLLKSWIGVFGIVTSIGLFIGNFEFFGLHQVFVVNRVFSALSGLWLLTLGIMLIFSKKPRSGMNRVLH